MNVRVLSFLMVAGAAASASLAQFSPGNLVVSRMGTGGAALSSAATPVFLDQFTIAGAPVNSTAMPTVGSGLNHAFTNGGSTSTEGQLTRSVDGRYLLLGGYDAPVGTAAVAGTTSATNPRIAAKVDMLANIDTTTALSDAYSGGAFRGVCSTDGNDLWMSGSISGVRYATAGASTSTLLSAAAPTNLRMINIFSNQLYVSSATGTAPNPTYFGVSSFGGSPPPTAGTASATNLPGMPTATESAYDFLFTNANTLYIADDRASTSSGGLQKWTFNGSVWSLAYTLTSGLGTGSDSGLRGLCSTTDALGNPVFYATTAGSSANRLVTVTDDGTGTSTFTVLATAATNTAFRGVEFAPVPAPSSLALLGAAGLISARRRRAK